MDASWKSLIVGFLFLTGCADQALPGTMLGIFAVTGKSTANTCGAGLAAPDPWNFSAQLAREGKTIHWSWLDGKPAESGILDDARTATITASQTSNVDGTSAGDGACAMRRTDTVTITLDADTAPTSFSGTLKYEFTAEPGAVCDRQLAASGGTYATLPCNVSYELSGTKK